GRWRDRRKSTRCWGWDDSRAGEDAAAGARLAGAAAVRAAGAGGAGLLAGADLGHALGRAELRHRAGRADRGSGGHVAAAAAGARSRHPAPAAAVPAVPGLVPAGSGDLDGAGGLLGDPHAFAADRARPGPAAYVVGVHDSLHHDRCDDGAGESRAPGRPGAAGAADPRARPVRAPGEGGRADPGRGGGAGESDRVGVRHPRRPEGARMTTVYLVTMALLAVGAAAALYRLGR